MSKFSIKELREIKEQAPNGATHYHALSESYLKYDSSLMVTCSWVFGMWHPTTVNIHNPSVASELLALSHTIIGDDLDIFGLIDSVCKHSDTELRPMGISPTQRRAADTHELLTQVGLINSEEMNKVFLDAVNAGRGMFESSIDGVRYISVAEFGAKWSKKQILTNKIRDIIKGLEGSSRNEVGIAQEIIAVVEKTLEIKL